MKSLFALTLIFCASLTSFSQAVHNTPVEHMDYFIKNEQELSKKYLSYVSEVAHGGRARKMEKRRMELLVAIKELLREAGKLKPYKADASLRDAYKEYWNVLLSVFNEDYHKIVDMEEIAERSYDAMEAYLLMQEKAGEKLDEAQDKVNNTYKDFAARNNVRLLEGGTSKLDKRLAQASRVSAYVNRVYLVFFKSGVQETLMLEALNRHDVNAIEQSRSSMVKFANEGLMQIDTIKAFSGDGSLTNACRKLLQFHVSEGTKMTAAVDFLVKHEEYLKVKKNFESKSANQRTKPEVDAYNNTLKDYNNSVNAYNKINHELNNGRSTAMTHWDNTRHRFMDQHAPYKM
jgi:hypothetical protein